MSEGQKFITFKVSLLELEALETYCDKTERTKTDVLRELIRSLETFSLLSLKENPETYSHGANKN
ncbi:MAG TPA: hypothetical protein V6D19_11735 [Stenomitos sp.]